MTAPGEGSASKELRKRAAAFIDDNVLPFAADSEDYSDPENIFLDGSCLHVRKSSGMPSGPS